MHSSDIPPTSMGSPKAVPATLCPTSDFGVWGKGHWFSSTFQMSTHDGSISAFTPVPCTSTMEMSKPLAEASWQQQWTTKNQVIMQPFPTKPSRMEVQIKENAKFRWSSSSQVPTISKSNVCFHVFAHLVSHPATASSSSSSSSSSSGCNSCTRYQISCKDALIHRCCAGPLGAVMVAERPSWLWNPMAAKQGFSSWVRIIATVGYCRM